MTDPYGFLIRHGEKINEPCLTPWFSESFRSAGLTAVVCVCINTHVMSSKEIIRLLQKHGWVMDRSKGSHHQFRHPSKPGLVTVPHPKKDLPTGTARAILKSAGLERTK